MESNTCQYPLGVTDELPPGVLSGYESPSKLLTRELGQHKSLGVIIFACSWDTSQLSLDRVGLHGARVVTRFDAIIGTGTKVLFVLSRCELHPNRS